MSLRILIWRVIHTIPNYIRFKRESRYTEVLTQVTYDLTETPDGKPIECHIYESTQDGWRKLP